MGLSAEAGSPRSKSLAGLLPEAETWAGVGDKKMSAEVFGPCWQLFSEEVSKMPLTKNENMDACHIGEHDGHSLLPKN